MKITEKGRKRKNPPKKPRQGKKCGKPVDKTFSSRENHGFSSFFDSDFSTIPTIRNVETQNPPKGKKRILDIAYVKK